MHVVYGQPVYDYSAPQPTPMGKMNSLAAPQSVGVTPVSQPVANPVSQPTGPPKNGNGSPKAIVPVFSRLTVDDQYAQLLLKVLGFLDDRSLLMLALVCRKYRNLAQPLLTQFVPPMLACGSSVTSLKDVIKNELQSVKTVQLAVDKFPPTRDEDSILSFIIRKKIELTLMLGDHNDRTVQMLQKGLANFKAAGASDLLNKMHNKFWVLDHDGVITGSPNVSFAGLEGGNLESFIIIRSARVASLFTSYLKLLESPNPFSGKQHDELKNALAKYNSEEHQLKLAMAPVVNITDFVIENLQGATKIIIRQFLISPKPKKDKGPGKDILTLLCGMAQAKVDIEIYLDEGQYNTQGFVRDGVAALMKAGCKVYLQKPVMVVDTGHESLMHDKLILATLHGGVQRTLLGSAGFTSSVIANTNAENFICTDVKGIYQACLKHHEESKKKSPALALK